MSRQALADGAQVALSTISRVERGVRRTRRSTLCRIAAALAAEDPLLGDADAVVAELTALAESSLAAESDYEERVARRRERRTRRREIQAHWAAVRKERDAAWAEHAEVVASLNALRMRWP